jgi:1,4-alpha-glucan branching enzyme
MQMDLEWMRWRQCCFWITVGKKVEWEPNMFGGRENLEAIAFMREMNEAVYSAFPDVQTIAEESTSFPMVSKPTYIGGLGFGMKWMMGWMHDTLQYFAKEPICFNIIKLIDINIFHTTGYITQREVRVFTIT